MRSLGACITTSRIATFLRFPVDSSVTFRDMSISNRRQISSIRREQSFAWKPLAYLTSSRYRHSVVISDFGRYVFDIGVQSVTVPEGVVPQYPHDSTQPMV